MKGGRKRINTHLIYLDCNKDIQFWKIVMLIPYKNQGLIVVSTYKMANEGLQRRGRK